MTPDRKPKWRYTDRVLTAAHAIYRAEHMCASCGNPKSICRDADGAFTVVTETCHAQKAVDQWREENQGKDPVPGQTLGLRYTPPTGVSGVDEFVKFDDQK